MEQTFDINYFKKKEHYLEVINRFALLLLDAETIDDIVWTVAKNAIAQLGYVDCVIYLVDDDGEYLRQCAAHGPKNPIDLDILNPIKIKVGEGIVGNVARNLKGEIVSDTSVDARYIFDNNMALSEIAVPIVHNQKIIGVIDSEHPDKNFYPADDLDILKTIASMTATKIVQARYNEKLQNYQNDLKALVNHKTIELNKTLTELKAQKIELTDSINYAKRIQKAVFQNPISIKKLLPESFFVYQPKDIISGDFYWVESIGDSILFAVADCTGHGVPGAIISVICHNAIKRAIRRNSSVNPALILNETRELVIDTFVGSDEDIKDGMDIAMCVYNTKTLELNYAGANINLHIITNNELVVIKANKQPIGQHIKSVPFTNHTLNIKNGDAIYLFTDGLADQFGGEKGKKFKYKQLRQLLRDSYQLSMEAQHDVINNAFHNWKGSLAQIDDVCVMGVRF